MCMMLEDSVDNYQSKHLDFLYLREIVDVCVSNTVQGVHCPSKGVNLLMRVSNQNFSTLLWEHDVHDNWKTRTQHVQTWTLNDLRPKKAELIEHTIMDGHVFCTWCAVLSFINKYDIITIQLRSAQLPEFEVTYHWHGGHVVVMNVSLDAFAYQIISSYFQAFTVMGHVVGSLFSALQFHHFVPYFLCKICKHLQRKRNAHQMIVVSIWTTSKTTSFPLVV